MCSLKVQLKPRWRLFECKSDHFDRQTERKDRSTNRRILFSLERNVIKMFHVIFMNDVHRP